MMLDHSCVWGHQSFPSVSLSNDFFHVRKSVLLLLRRVIEKCFLLFTGGKKQRSLCFPLGPSTPILTWVQEAKSNAVKKFEESLRASKLFFFFCVSALTSTFLSCLCVLGCLWDLAAPNTNSNMQSYECAINDAGLQIIMPRVYLAPESSYSKQDAVC